MVALTKNTPRPGWHSRFGGIEWNCTPAGIETREGGVLRTSGKPLTMQRIIGVWGSKLRNISIVTQVPLPILMMTLAVEGGLQWKKDHFIYPPLRKEPGYTSDDATPHRISFGPMHVLLSSYRSVMFAPKATREEAMVFSNNVYAAAMFVRNTEHKHGWDPILIAASYNAGGVYDASDPASRFYNPFHIRAWSGHLDRAARWYGDACAVLAEKPVPALRSRLSSEGDG